MAKCHKCGCLLPENNNCCPKCQETQLSANGSVKSGKSEVGKDIFVQGEVISSYTREQAIEDGYLIDITNHELTKEAGFKVPLAITRDLWHKIEVPKDLEGMQDLKGRLWDVLFMAKLAFKSALIKSEEAARLVSFKVILLDSKTTLERCEKEGKELKPIEVWLTFNEHEGFCLMLPSDY